MRLEEIVPWGRSFEEYAAMFALGPKELASRIIGCGDGPAAFNATLTARGGDVRSFDPIYAFDAAMIRSRIATTFEKVLAGMKKDAGRYVWRTIPDVEALGRVRMSAMDTFLDDYAAGLKEGRYIAGRFPESGLPSDSADLALCSHLLFLYSEHMTQEDHIVAIREMLRLAPEARVFPLRTLDGDISPHLEPVRRLLETEGHVTLLEKVPYEFQVGADTMLVVRRPEAPLANPRVLSK